MLHALSVCSVLPQTVIATRSLRLSADLSRFSLVMSNHGGKHAGAGPKSANYYATGYKPAGTSDVRVAPDPELEAAQVKMERLLQEARGQRKA